MSLGWWTGVLLVATVIGAASAEGETPALAETPQLSAASEDAFDPARLAASMDRAASKSQPRVQAQIGLEGSEAPGLTKILAQLLFSLVLVVGLIYGLSYGLKKFAGRNLFNPSGPLKVLARHSVSQKSSVYLVAAFDRFLIIGESPQGLTCLSQFADPEENEKLRRAWGWEESSEPAPSFGSKAAAFTPVFHSHVTELEREIDRFREVSR
jgi:flagellar biogenesis protein FliO